MEWRLGCPACFLLTPVNVTGYPDDGRRLQCPHCGQSLVLRVKAAYSSPWFEPFNPHPAQPSAGDPLDAPSSHSGG